MYSVIKDERDNFKKEEYSSHNLLNGLNNLFQNNDNQSKTKTKNIHKNSVKCLFNCTQYKLNLTIKHEKTVVGYQFLNSNNYYYSNISGNQIL
jgi:predicted metal-binding protein